MKRFISKIASIMVLCAMPAVMVSAATQPPPEGGVLPEIVLPAPHKPEHLTYLGIKENQPFTIPQIDARIVIVEIFSMY